MNIWVGVIALPFALLIAYGASHDVRRAYEAWLWRRDQKRCAHKLRERLAEEIVQAEAEARTFGQIAELETWFALPSAPNPRWLA